MEELGEQSPYDQISRIIRESIQEESDTFVKVQRDWAMYCPGVDEVLEEYAKDVNGEIEKWKEDTPSRALIWKRNHWYDRRPLGFSISMLLETKEIPFLRISAASWADDENSLKRYHMELNQLLVPVPASKEFISDAIKTFGHVLRIFNGGAENRNLMEEIENLQGPRNIGLHFHQTDLSH